jgi:hypothetical protein
VVAKARERLALNKKQVSNSFAALEDFNADIDINNAWETIKGISKSQPNRV